MNRSINEIRREEINRDFKHRLSTPEEDKQLEIISEAAKAFAMAVIDTVPWSVQRDYAVIEIRQVAMLARDALLTFQQPLCSSHETKEGHKIQFLAL